MVDSETFSENFDKIKNKIKDTWDKLTDQDLESIKGQKDKLVTMVAEKYGETKEVINQKLENITDKYNK